MTETLGLEKAALQALRERGRASFADLLEEGILPDRAAVTTVRRRLVARGAIRRVGVRSVERHCATCACGDRRSVGRPRVEYEANPEGHAID